MAEVAGYGVKNWVAEQDAQHADLVKWFTEKGGAPYRLAEWTEAGTAAKAEGKAVPHPNQFGFPAELTDGAPALRA